MKSKQNYRIINPWTNWTNPAEYQNTFDYSGVKFFDQLNYVYFINNDHLRQLNSYMEEMNKK